MITNRSTTIMTSKTDYTPVILAQLTDLATRVTQLEIANHALRAEVSRLSARPVSGTAAFGAPTAPTLGSNASNVTNTSTNYASRVQMSIPIANAAGGFGLGARQTTDNPVPSRKPATASVVAAAPKEYKPLTIQDVLLLNETVTIEVGIGKDAAGNFLQTTCVTTFDGVTLTVTNCELVPSLVGMSTTKPGEILYRFIEDLKNHGHIKKPFTIAPWRLCFVVRNGKKLSLEDLRDF